MHHYFARTYEILVDKVNHTFTIYQILRNPSHESKGDNQTALSMEKRHRFLSGTLF